MTSVAGCTLGPMRTVVAMPNEPWLLSIINVPGSKFHAVVIRASPSQSRRVAIVDGVGKTGSDNLQLVGVEMVVSERWGGVADRLSQLVSWPATTAQNALVKPLPWEQVTHPAILIAHTVHNGDADVEPAKRQFGLVDPGTSFPMIQVTIGRIRVQLDSLVRVLVLKSVADIWLKSALGGISVKTTQPVMTRKVPQQSSLHQSSPFKVP